MISIKSYNTHSFHHFYFFVILRKHRIDLLEIGSEYILFPISTFVKLLSVTIIIFIRLLHSYIHTSMEMKRDMIFLNKQWTLSLVLLLSYLDPLLPFIIHEGPFTSYVDWILRILTHPPLRWHVYSIIEGLFPKPWD